MVYSCATLGSALPVGFDEGEMETGRARRGKSMQYFKFSTHIRCGSHSLTQFVLQYMLQIKLLFITICFAAGRRCVCLLQYASQNIGMAMSPQRCSCIRVCMPACSTRGAVCTEPPRATRNTPEPIRTYFLNHFNRVKITVGGRETRVSLHNNVMRVLLLFVCVCM